MVHILFIDDDPNAHNTIKMIFKDEYKISSAYTGNQGIKRVYKLDPDIILLDISLPDIDGITVLKELKNLKQPVIMLTASNEINILIGPEGGFTDKEITDIYSYGFKPVYLGKEVLRVETAALYAIASIKTLLLELKYQEEI